VAVKFLTFDCYDTLVAYSAAKASAIRDMVGEKGGDANMAAAAIEVFSNRERDLHAAREFRPLGEVLRASLEAALSAQGLAPTPADGTRIVQAVCEARPFDDVKPALDGLRDHFRLAILSNSESAIMTHNIASMGVPFDEVVLAEQVRCYKPDVRMFHALLERCQCGADEIIHVAQGFYHDIIPGHALGLRRVWINRNALAGDQAYGPYDELPDLSGLAKLLGV
jgi:2-haloacid dehalogenase